MGSEPNTEVLGVGAACCEMPVTLEGGEDGRTLGRFFSVANVIAFETLD